MDQSSNLVYDGAVQRQFNENTNDLILTELCMRTLMSGIIPAHFLVVWLSPGSRV